MTVSLGVLASDAPELPQGAPVVTKVRAPFLLDEGSVEIESKGDDGARETWTALGRGTIDMGALVAGQPTTITLDAVALRRALSSTKPALEGILSGTLHATIAAPLRIVNGGGCPARVPGAP